MNLNRVELIGNLTADPVVKTLPSGSRIVSFSLATRYDWKDSKTKEPKHKTEFHAVVAYGQLAGVVAKYLKKGDRVYLEGRLRTTQWQGKDESWKYRTEVIAVNLIMLGTKSGRKSEKANDEVVVEEVPSDQV